MTNRAYAKSNGDGLLCSILWLRWRSRRASTFFTSEIVSLILSCEESVNTLSKVVGFLRVLRFPPTGKVCHVNTVMKVISQLL